MPSTVNGIGTHYYGKKNFQKRVAACPHCGRNVELISYDTRLWFVVVFIPIIPLGRKRIIDCCPACSRHYAMDADKWETARQLEVSGAMEKFRANPTPEAAMAAHQQLLNFHQLEDAAGFRKTMREKYVDNAKVQAYLGVALEHFGQFDEAADYFSRALQLRPDLPEARVGVAMGHIRSGRLDSARKLLDFLEKPGAAQLYSLQPLEVLARAYQESNHHDDALELFTILQKELPKLAEEKWFRSLVAKSEKDSGRRDSRLPKLKFSWKRFFGGGGRGQGFPQITMRSLLILGIFVSLMGLGFVVSNEYIRRHRTLHLVNAFAQPAVVQISGINGVRGIRGLGEMVLPEGKYHAVISGPIQEELDFEITSGYFDRWFADPAWVLNVGGAGVFMLQRVVYAKDPPPASVSFHFGKTFERFPAVTHPFMALPESLQIKENEQRTLSGLSLYRESGAGLFNYFTDQHQFIRALDFAETWLHTHPDDRGLIRLYYYTSASQNQNRRADDYLKAGLTNRPVSIEWHRAYQTLHDKSSEHDSLVGYYQAMLEKDPTNSALLYLRGRIDSDRNRCRDFFEKAKQADSRNSYPVFALGYDRLVAGDWIAARQLMEQAVELDSRDGGFAHWLFVARLALGESAAIEQEMQQKLRQEQFNVEALLCLIDAQIAQGHGDDAMQALRTFETRYRSQFQKADSDALVAIRRHAQYALGDFISLEKGAANDATPSGRYVLAEALLEQGRVTEAARVLPDEIGTDAKMEVMLALAVAFHQTGDFANAKLWRDRAVTALQNGNEDSVRAASLIARTTAPTREEVESIALSLGIKAVYVVALAQKFPEVRVQLTAFARRLNVEREFPFHLVQRATDVMR